jgi:hypothetical protein
MDYGRQMGSVQLGGNAMSGHIPVMERISRGPKATQDKMSYPFRAKVVNLEVTIMASCEEPLHLRQGISIYLMVRDGVTLQTATIHPQPPSLTASTPVEGNPIAITLGVT